MLTLILSIAIYYVTSSILRSDSTPSPVVYGKKCANFHEMTSRNLIIACRVQGIRYTGMNKAQMIEELYSYTY